MEETKAERQNRTLKVILLLILVPIVSGGSIAAYHFLTRSDSDEVASKDKKTPNAANTSVPAAAPSAATPPAATPSPAAPTPAQNTVPFAGRWLMTGPSKTVYYLEKPKKVGTSEVGLMRVSTPGGKSYDSNYTIHDRQSDEFEANGSTYHYELSNGGRSLKLEYDGNVMYFDRVR